MPSIQNDGTARQGAVQAAEAIGDRFGTPTKRQRRLHWLWSFFRAENYDHLPFEWDGAPALEADSLIVGQQDIPGGFETTGGELAPMGQRKPCAPYPIGRVIVERFTGLLFSQRRHPIPRVPGDPDTEDFLQCLTDEGRLWARMIQARNMGGSMGSVALTFRVANGRPVFEVFDPRWCHVEFVDRHELDVHRLEVRYAFEESTRQPDGSYADEKFWYRRVIDCYIDETWRKVPYGDGQEPNWTAIPTSLKTHVLDGECPVVWIQNQEVLDEVDGDPDALGTFPMMLQMDRLNAQATSGTLANADPTLLIKSDEEISNLKKGSGNTIKLMGAGSASYLELTGAGANAATRLADRYEKMICRVARVVLDQSGSAVAKTATEVDKDYSAMLEKADVLREQYGERGLKKLLRYVLRACRKSLEPRVNPETNEIETPALDLPLRATTDPKTGETTYAPRKLGPSNVVALQWGPYFQPTLADANTAVQAAKLAKEGELVTAESATKFVAPYFGVEDVRAERHHIEADKDADMKKMEEMAMKQMAMQKAADAESDSTPPPEGNDAPEMTEDEQNKILDKDDEDEAAENAAPDAEPEGD